MKRIEHKPKPGEIEIEFTYEESKEAMLDYLKKKNIEIPKCEKIFFTYWGDGDAKLIFKM